MTEQEGLKKLLAEMPKGMEDDLSKMEDEHFEKSVDFIKRYRDCDNNAILMSSLNALAFGILHKQLKHMTKTLDRMPESAKGTLKDFITDSMQESMNTLLGKLEINLICIKAR